MCGIVAYKGDKKASSILLEGLRILEYRGYDSVGMAVLNDDFELRKDVGQVDQVNNKLKFEEIEGSCGIAHTRWATHGKVTKENAHPHVIGNIAIVHNGIIENYQGLRKEIKTELKTETDTEILGALINQYLEQSYAFDCAVVEVAKKLKGRSAFVVIDKSSKQMIAIRQGAPLIVGVGENEYFIASDITAFLKYTNKVMYLDDGQGVLIDNKPEFFKLSGGEIEKRIITIDWKPGSSDKEGYKHFLLKEIMEQKESLYRAINQKDEKIMHVADQIKQAYGSFLIGCGTAGKVAMTGEYLFSKVAGKHINSYIASEFPNYQHYLTPKSLIIAISQSGETADVLEAIESAKKKGSKVISLLNVEGSTMMRQSDEHFIVNAGVERAVVSTKATTAQLAVLTLLTYAVTDKLKEGKLLLMNTAEQVNDMLNPRYEEHVKKLAEKLQKKNNMYLIGRSLNYPIALEAAIKLQETAYINAQGFAGGELKHGPIALIEQNTPCLAIVANDDVKDEIISNAIELKSRGAYIIGVAPENNEVFDYWLKVPDAGNASPIVNIIPIQMLAYHIAILKGLDPDKPRNLAKSVTVK